MKKFRVKSTILLLCVIFMIWLPVTVHAENKVVRLGEYPQSKVTDSTLAANLNKLTVGADSTVTYNGRRYYLKSEDDSKGWFLYEPIEWIVLKSANGKALVLSRKVLDSCGLSTAWDDTAWDNSVARKWLNSTFHNRAFSAAEKACIYTTNVVNESCKNTSDKIYYPSSAELRNEEYGFAEAKDRAVQCTEFSGANTYLTRDTSYILGLGMVCGVYSWDGYMCDVPVDAWWGARPCMNIDLTKAAEVEKDKETVKKKDFKKAKVSLSKTSYKFDGKLKSPTATVKYDGKKLVKDKDFTVSYINNKYVGKASVVLKGKGMYEGTITKYFTISSPGSITVKFNANGGKLSKKLKNVSRGKKYGILPEATKKGYKFSGWYTAKKDGKKITANSYVETAKTQTLYAQWKKNTYKITYKLNGGKNSKKNPKSYTVTSKRITFKNPARTGYIFKGWYLDSKYKKKVTSISKGSTGNKTLYAKWSAVTYNISFHGNGSVATKMTAMKSLKYGHYYKLKKNTFKAPAGQEFKEWNTSQRGTGKSFKDMERVSDLTTRNDATIKLYAQWQLIRYNIKYVLPKGVKNSSGNPSSYNKIETVKFKNPSSMRGYIFMGWYTSEIGGTRVSAIKKGSTGYKTLYARFKPITYTVRFNGNGYTDNVPAEMTCTYGKQYSVPDGGDYKWNTCADGTGTTFTGGQSFSNLALTQGALVTLYAMKQYEEAWFPAKIMNLEQIPYEKWSGQGKNTEASHFEHNAIDILPGGDVFAPFTGTIEYIDPAWGYVLLVSDKEVRWADGSIGKMSVGFMHDSDVSDLHEGDHLQQGQPFYQAGGQGVKNGVPIPNCYGAHVDISVFRGAIKKEWIKNQKKGRGDEYAFNAFFINSKITTIASRDKAMGKLEENNILTRKDAPSDWKNLWRYLK